MKICLDTRQVLGKMTGLGRYALNLARALAQIDTENEYLLLKNPSCSTTLVEQKNFREIVVPFEISSAKNIFLGSRVINPLKVDIYHALFHFLPFQVNAGRVIVTLHDLMWEHFPALVYTDGLSQWYVKHIAAPLIHRALRVADQVIAISQATAEDAIQTYRLNSQKFQVIHHGVDPVFLNESGETSGQTPSFPYLFSLGHSRPYKNIPALIRAFSKISGRYPDLRLVIAGRGDQYDALRNLAENLRVAERVLFKGHLSDAEVGAYFRKAQMFVFPSLIEGFGFPVLEAMMAGCPVVTSNRYSLPEIAGDAALQVNPEDVDSMANAICSLLENESLRRDLSQRGLERAKGFTWRNCAEKTLELYRQASVGR